MAWPVLAMYHFPLGRGAWRRVPSWRVLSGCSTGRVRPGARVANETIAAQRTKRTRFIEILGAGPHTRLTEEWQFLCQGSVSRHNGLRGGARRVEQRVALSRQSSSQGGRAATQLQAEYP